jgi:hypothetical protein
MKNVLFIMLMICISVDVCGQWKFSAIGGSTLANFGGADKKEWGGTNTNPKAVMRFHLGLQAEYTLSDKFSLSAGIQYSAKGARYKGDVPYYSPETGGLTVLPVVYKKRLAYIDVPILVNYRLSDQFDILLGVQPSILLSAKIRNDENAQKAYNLPKKEDARDSYKTFDVAVLIGPRYRINERMYFQLLYNHGLTKIAHEETYDYHTGTTGQDYKVMNRVLKFSVAYTLKQ